MKTIRLKVKPEAYQWLRLAAIEVNQVFNYCNETLPVDNNEFAWDRREV